MYIVRLHIGLIPGIRATGYQIQYSANRIFCPPGIWKNWYLRPCISTMRPDIWSAIRYKYQYQHLAFGIRPSTKAGYPHNKISGPSVILFIEIDLISSRLVNKSHLSYYLNNFLIFKYFHVKYEVTIALFIRRQCTKLHNEILIEFEEMQNLLNKTEFLACQLCWCMYLQITLYWIKLFQ